MSTISDFAARVDAYNDTIDNAIEGLKGDIKFLTDTVTTLQNSVGTVTAEDQALIDKLEARIKTISDKVVALDAQTPPATPPG